MRMGDRLSSRGKEGVLFAIFSLLLLLAFTTWARFVASRDEFHRNMRLALMQCGAMLRNGQKEELSHKIVELRESEAFKEHYGCDGFLPQQPYLMSKAFRETMLPETVDTRRISGAVLLVGGGIWGIFLVVWMLLHLCRAHSERRLVFLKSSICISAFFLFAAFVGRSVDNGYRINGLNFDLNGLQQALSRPDIPLELFELLENPLERGPYQYLPYSYNDEKWLLQPR